MIRHNVVFGLVHAEGSPEEEAFFEAARRLAEIPVVRNFQLFREVNPRNDQRFAASMDFADLDAFRAYSAHPIHDAFRAAHRANMVDVREFDTEPL